MSQTTEGSNGVIQADLTGGADSNRTVDKNWTITQPSGTPGTTITETTQTAKKTHNGVTWTYSNKCATGATAATSNEITITGENINIYKAKSGNNGYQTYINNAPTARADEGKVTVKITLVPNTATSSSSGSQSVKK